MRRALIAGLLAALAAGCGSQPSSSGPSGGASVAPASSAAFLRVKTDLGDSRRNALGALLKLVPGSRTLPSLDTLAGALGPETDAVALTSADLDAGTLVGLTQPPSSAKLHTVLAKHDPPLVAEDVAGWQVVAARRATIDRFKRARNGGMLADDDTYQEATAGLPATAVATVYAPGETVTAELGRRTKAELGPIPGVGRVSWLAGSVETAPGGLQADFRVKGDEIEPVEYTAELPAKVPAPVSLFVDAKGLDATLDELRRSPVLTGQAATVAKALGGLLDEVIALFKGEAAFYVRPLPAGPEYTLVLQVEDEASAEGTLDRLATLVSAFGQTVPSHLSVQGVPVTKITIGKTTLYYAVLSGKVVITSATSGIRGLALPGPKLAGTKGWKAAAAAADLPNETAGIVYADVRRTLPLLAKLTGSSAPKSVPFTTGLVYATVDGSVLSIQGFVGVR